MHFLELTFASERAGALTRQTYFLFGAYKRASKRAGALAKRIFFFRPPSDKKIAHCHTCRISPAPVPLKGLYFRRPTYCISVFWRYFQPSFEFFRNLHPGQRHDRQRHGGTRCADLDNRTGDHGRATEKDSGHGLAPSGWKGWTRKKCGVRRSLHPHVESTSDFPASSTD